MKMYTDKEINEMAQPLFDVMAQRVSPEEMEKIHRAFELAKKAHAKKVRKSGNPYIVHPIAVARIVGEELMLGANPVCAAFLHDVVEDTSYTKEDIRKMFGDDVAFLVDVVTKKDKEEYDVSKQVDNYQQLLGSIKYDIRALLIKLADRLHNMRTLDSMPPNKQMKIAGETDFFYAPLANRLGLYNIKIELENLSFKFRCPRKYANMEHILEKHKVETAPILDAFMKKVEERLSANGVKATTEVYYRRPFSICRKVARNGEDSIADYRQFVRVVYDAPEGMSDKFAALYIYGLLTDVFHAKNESFVNYIDTPKSNGYQSLHVKLQADNGMWMEVHISSTTMRRKSRLGCLAEREEGKIQQWIEGLKKTLEEIATKGCEIKFIDGIRDWFYNDDIVVYTPNGREITLPKDSSALDFAFQINPETGLHAQYARINGKLCSVKTHLKRGDCVEIGTHKDSCPNESWLEHVKTYDAKNGIKSWLSHRPESEYESCPYCHPLPGDEVVGFKKKSGKIEMHKRDCSHAISKASQHGDSVVTIEFLPEGNVLYPISIHIRAIDRKHLLCELIDCITNTLNLPIDSILTKTVDNIVDCDIAFFVHSFDELDTVITSLNSIKNVDEVWQQEL